MSVSQAKKLCQMEKENKRLKRLLAKRNVETTAWRSLQGKLVCAPERGQRIDTLERKDILERRACELVGIARSNYRYEPRPRDGSELEERVYGI